MTKVSKVYLYCFKCGKTRRMKGKDTNWVCMTCGTTKITQRFYR